MRKNMHERRGFTLVELLMVISIIAILAAISTAALLNAAETGKQQRARAQIAKIDQLIQEKWNSYRYRKVPIRIAASIPANVAAQQRLEALRELMKCELPDRMQDINPANTPHRLSTIPSLTRAYARKVSAAGVPYSQTALEQAECLYLILSEMRDGDKSALSFFMTSEIGDIDADGLPEILDPWGTPIIFLRWAPGYSRVAAGDTEIAGLSTPQIFVQSDTLQVPNGSLNGDPFDPLRTDPRWNPSGWMNHAAVCKPFSLKPLILSAGPDRKSDIYATLPSGAGYLDTPVTKNDPYVIINAIDQTTQTYVSSVDQSPTDKWVWIGMAVDMETFVQTGQLRAPIYNGDNITNHGLELEGE